jgi:hypothetical protein
VELTVVLRLVLGGWDVADADVEPVLVDRVHPGEDIELEVVDASPGSLVANQPGLVQADHRLGEGPD